MPPVPTISSFNQWLLSDRRDNASSCAIVLHSVTDSPGPWLHQSLVEYLNEYDEAADGHWLAAESSLVQAIASDAGMRRQLNITEPSPDRDGHCPQCLKSTLRALALRGHVVLDSPLAAAATHALPNTFHVAVGFPVDGLDDCHMVLNPDRFQPRCLPQIIGDTFLEWLNCRRRPEPLRST